MNSSIKDQENQKIDFNKTQLLQCVKVNEDQSLIVMTSGDHGGNTFQGMVVQQENTNRFIGEVDKSFSKRLFKIFNGTLELSN